MASDVSINETRILRGIWENPGISRISLSRDLSLAKSAVTKIVSGLIDEGLVVQADTPDVTESQGRRPVGLSINGCFGTVLGFEIRTDRWYGVALDLDGKILDRFESEASVSEGDLVDVIAEALAEGERRQRAAGRKVIGAGLGMSGLVNPYQCVLLESNPLHVHRPLYIGDALRSRFDYPIVIENDANCCCWNVLLEKHEHQARNFLAILGELRRTGRGPADGYSEVNGIAVGLGVFLKGGVHHGSGFSAGEFQSVMKRAPNPTQFEIPFERLADVATDRKLWESVVGELARNVSLLVNVLNLTQIKVFGDFVIDEEFVRNTILEEINWNWLYQNEVTCSVEFSSRDEHVVAAGAAAFFVERSLIRADVWEGDQPAYPMGIELLRTSHQLPAL